MEGALKLDPFLAPIPMSSQVGLIDRAISPRKFIWWTAILSAPFVFIALMNHWFDSLAQPNSIWRVKQVRSIVSQAAAIEELPSDGWKSSTLPSLTFGDGQRATSVWYRIEVNVDRPQEALWAVYLLSPSDNYAVFVNGHFAGESAPMTRPISRYQTPLVFRFPGTLLHEGVNVVQVHSVNEIAWTILHTLEIGPDKAISPGFRSATFAAETLKQIIIGCLLAIGLVMAALSGSRSREAVFGWYAVALFFMAAHISIKLVPQLFFGDGRLWYNLEGIAMGGYIVCATFFINRFVGVKRPRVEKWLVIWALIGAVVLICDPVVFGFSMPWFAYIVWIPPMLPLCVYQTWLIVRAAREAPSAESLSVALVTCLGLVVGVRDGLIEMGLKTGPLYLAYAMVPVLCTFGSILLRRFVRALNTSEWAREELEVRVAEKTEELSRSLVRMKDMERDQALSAERDRIMRDMHDGVGGQLVQALSIATSRAELKSIEEPLRSCLDELRLIIDSIEPVNGDLASVLGTLRMRMSRRLTEAGVQLRWRVEDIPVLANFGPNRVLHISRIVHEAIANSLKHSHAKQITLATRLVTNETGQLILIEIADNGAGFAATVTRGRGLINMKRRAQDLDARLSIDSSAQGTTVRLAFPIDALATRECASSQAPKHGPLGVAQRL
jgi:signal transduction histidine kinase